MEEIVPGGRGAREIGGLEFGAFGFQPESGLIGIEEREGIKRDGGEDGRRMDEVEVGVDAREGNMAWKIVRDGGVEFEINIREGMVELIEGAMGEVGGAFSRFLPDPAAVAGDEVKTEKEKGDKRENEKGDARGRKEAAEGLRLKFARRSHG